MNSRQSDSLFVPEDSPAPTTNYAVAEAQHERRLTPSSDNGVSAIMSPQAYQADRLRQSAAAESAGELHDPTHEPLSDHAYFGLEIQALHDEIDTALRDLWISLQGFEDDDAEMENQRDVIQRGRDIGAPKPLIVTTVGPAGVGKSFLYKALFNRANITKSSAEGRSCTLYPTKFLLQPGAAADTTRSDIDVEFFDAATIAAMTESHIRRYHDYHFDPNSDPTDDDSRLYASTAEEFFHVAFDTKDNADARARLQLLLTADRITNGDLFPACIDAIEQLISSSGPIKNGKLSYSQVEDNEIDQIRNIADSLAPFIDFLVIKTGSALLNAGLTLIDLPGEVMLQTLLTSANVSRAPRHQSGTHRESQRHTSRRRC